MSALPSNYKTLLTNPSFRVIAVRYGPHEKVPVHDHPAVPTVFIYLNNSSPVRISHEEQAEPSSTIRPPTQAGAFRIGPGIVERHSVENLGDLESIFLRVELLNLRPEEKIVELRGKAPTDLTHNLSATEFSSPALSITRTICIDPTPCAVAPSPMSSVIVAISASTVTTNGHQTTLRPGDVIPVAPQQSLQISPINSQPAHILQVLVRTSTIR
jgi:hypothetical protein